ncbi:virion structural protein [Aeromonas phage BUCT695]|uniref:virion structural protein n=1 Tax=Aeromonas phage BUCT695 TaxID=2908630 RepID=UPI002329038C|nr:virion structural protein [Aeromonas phage BUCT695]UIW10588.1 hypothetical protein [Aeromonas phage BUCT695]
MNEVIKNILIGVATALSIASVSVGINTYIDVQILKNSESEQQDFVKTTKDILNRIDKTQAVQTETIKALSDVVYQLRDGQSQYKGGYRG